MSAILYCNLGLSEKVRCYGCGLVVIDQVCRGSQLPAYLSLTCTLRLMIGSVLFCTPYPYERASVDSTVHVIRKNLVGNPRGIPRTASVSHLLTAWPTIYALNTNVPNDRIVLHVYTVTHSSQILQLVT